VKGTIAGVSNHVITTSSTQTTTLITTTLTVSEEPLTDDYDSDSEQKNTKFKPKKDQPMNGTSASSSTQSSQSSTHLDDREGIDLRHWRLLDTDLSQMLQHLRHAKQFEVPDIGEVELVGLVQDVLTKYGPVPVGKMGSLLHNMVNNHSLPSMLKERYGGLKKIP